MGFSNSTGDNSSCLVLKTYVIQGTEVSKDYVSSRAIYGLFDLKTRYNDWISYHVLKSSLYKEGIEYRKVMVRTDLGRSKIDYWIDINIGWMLCRNLKTDKGKKEAARLKNQIFNSYNSPRTIKRLKEDLQPLVDVYVALGENKTSATTMAIESLEKEGVHIPAILKPKRKVTGKPVFNIGNMARILDLTPKNVITILCDMGILVHEKNKALRCSFRGKKYLTNLDETETIHHLEFCPETLVLIDVKSDLEIALFWDTEAKKPRRLPEEWLETSAAMIYLNKNNIKVNFLIN